MVVEGGRLRWAQEAREGALTHRLGHELAHRLPPGVHPPAHASPSVVQHLPAAIHAAYTAAYAAALHPVFLTAAAVMLGAFALSWRLREVPLRETAGASGEEVGVRLAAQRQLHA